MLSARFKPWHVPVFLAKYAYLRARRRPVLVHFEVTMRCNAKCSFCDYWKTSPEARATELKSFADAARHFVAARPPRERGDEVERVVARREVFDVAVVAREHDGRAREFDVPKHRADEASAVSPTSPRPSSAS